MLIENLINQSISIFILIIIGYVIRKRELICERDTVGITNIVVMISLPATIIMSMTIEFSRERLYYATMTALVSFAAYFFKYIIWKLFSKTLKLDSKESSVHGLMILLSNCGFMGIPIAGAIYGKEGLFYTAIVNLCFSIVSWTLGIKLISKGVNREYSTNIKGIAKNPGIMSVVIGLIIFLVQIKLPEFIENPLVTIAATTTPLAMFSIGAFLTQADIKSVFKDKDLIISSFLRLIISPLIVIVLVKAFKIPVEVAGVIVLLEAMPAATTSAIFARKFDSDYELASKGIFLSTILSLGTIPIIMSFYQMII